MKVVLDVNVWISGFLWGGVPGKVLRLVFNEQIDSYVSAELLSELAVTLRWSKFKEKLLQRNRTVEDFLTAVTEISETVEVQKIEVAKLRDDKDLKIVATAVAAKADVLISGDLDILVLKSFQGTSMLNATQFLKLMET